MEKQSEAGNLQSKQGQQQAANRGRNGWNGWRDLFGTSATASGRTRDDSEIPGVQTTAGSFAVDISTTEIPREDSPPNPEPIATVSTDQSDYGPGETVLITASGFQPGTSIIFTLADDPQDPGDDGDADLYPSFSVTDGSAADQDGVVDGRVVTSWLVPTDDDGTGSGRPDALNATVLLTATGADGEVAFHTFTDSAPTVVTDKADVPVQGVGRLGANIGPAEPLTAAGFPVASQAETACDEHTSGWDFRGGLAGDSSCRPVLHPDPAAGERTAAAPAHRPGR